jgi:hypothetical protein
VDGFRFGPARIDVESDDAGAARWLREFLVPWFETCPPGAGEFRVCLRVSPASFEKLARRQAAASSEPRACFALDSQTACFPGWTDAEGSALAEPERGCFYRFEPAGVEIVTAAAPPRVRVALMRAVREIAALRRLEAAGCLDLHAAAFAVKDRAVLLVGPKRAGKTTLLASALGSGRADLIANDRVLAEPDAGAVRAFGVPTLVSIRPDTLERFPALRSPVAGGSAQLTADEIEAQRVSPSPDAAPVKYALSPAQLAQQLGAGAATGAPIAAIVFPEIDPRQSGWSLARLPTAEAGARLRECLYGATLIDRPRTVFDELVGARPARREQSAQQVARLAERIPVFTCRLGPDAYREGSAGFLEALSL